MGNRRSVSSLCHPPSSLSLPCALAARSLFTRCFAFLWSALWESGPSLALTPLLFSPLPLRCRVWLEATSLPSVPMAEAASFVNRFHCRCSNEPRVLVAAKALGFCPGTQSCKVRNWSPRLLRVWQLTPEFHGSSVLSPPILPCLSRAVQ